MEETRNLAIDVLDRFRFALVRLQNFQKLLVDVWLRSKAVLFELVTNHNRQQHSTYLYLVDIADSVVEFHGPTLFVHISSIGILSCRSLTG